MKSILQAFSNMPGKSQNPLPRTVVALATFLIVASSGFAQETPPLDALPESSSPETAAKKAPIPGKKRPCDTSWSLTLGPTLSFYYGDLITESSNFVTSASGETAVTQPGLDFSARAAFETVFNRALSLEFGLGLDSWNGGVGSIHAARWYSSQGILLDLLFRWRFINSPAIAAFADLGGSGAILPLSPTETISMSGRSASSTPSGNAGVAAFGILDLGLELPRIIQLDKKTSMGIRIILRSECGTDIAKAGFTAKKIVSAYESSLFPVAFNVQAGLFTCPAKY